MPETKFYEDLNEKSLEIILNFKPLEKFDKTATNEILKLKNDIKKAITLLSKEEQQVLEFRYFKNLSTDNTAQTLGKTKEEVVQVLFSGIENIKRIIKSSEQKADNIKSFVDLSKIEAAVKKQQQSSREQNSSGQPSVLAAAIVFLIFILILSTGFYFLFKFLSSQIPNVSKFVNGANTFVQEQFYENEIVNKVIPGKKKGSSSIDARNIKISGSTSLLALSRRWQNAFSIEYPKYHVGLIPSDSDEGIKALLDGKVDIANSSRPVGFFDQKKANEGGHELVENRVALDALLIIVNDKNPIEEINLDDLEAVFSGQVKTWSSLSALQKPIIPVVREKGSGTNDFVVNRVLEGNDFPSVVQRKKSNEEIIKFISDNEGAISFINSTNYPWGNKNIKYLKIKNYPTSLAVNPFIDHKLNEQAIRYGDYPLAHYLYLITLSDAPKKVQDFVDWVLTPKGQEIVKYSGLISIYSGD